MRRFLADSDPAENPGLLIAKPVLIVVGGKDDEVPTEPWRKLVHLETLTNDLGAFSQLTAK